MGVVFEPVMGVTVPGTAARRLAASGAGWIILTTVLWSLVIGTAFSLAVDASTFQSGTTTYSVGGQSVTVREPGAWSFAWMTVTVALIAALVPAPLAAIVAFTQTPLLYRTGSAAGAFWAAFASVLSNAGLVVLIICITRPLVEFDPLWQELAPGDERIPMIVATSLLLLVLRIKQAVFVVAMAQPAPPDHGPTCEGCGYGLTHVPDGGRCPECGLAAAASLDSRLRRTGVPWQNAASHWARAGRWFGTTVAILWRPREFYSRLCFRGGDAAAQRYQNRTIAAIAALVVVAVLAEAILTLYGGPSGNWGMIVMMTTALLLGACTAHAICVGPAGWAWIAVGALHDYAIARQVLRYEFAYAGCFVLYVLAIFADAAHDVGWLDWLAQSLPRSVWMWGPPQPLLFLGGCVLLGLAWWWRLARILAVVRWANF